MSVERFERLVAEAERQPFEGWDFSYIAGRYREGSPSWDYRASARTAIVRAGSLLDMGTGGGEFLSTLAPLPSIAFATEAYPPNVPVARRRLKPLGVRVVAIQSDKQLPFEDGTFDLVINRHEAFWSTEVYRILKPGGTFITQQVGGRNNLELNQLLQEREEIKEPTWGLEGAVGYLEAAGFRIVDGREELIPGVFRDIGAVVYYLKAIPWQIRGFTIEAYRERLAWLHDVMERSGGLEVHIDRFYVEAVKS